VLQSLNSDSDESFLLYLAIKLKTMIWRKNNEKKKKKNDSCCCERRTERRRRTREEGRASSFHFSLLIK
jgi:hypothetical protein